MSIALQNISRRRLLSIIKKAVKEKWEFIAINSPPNKHGKRFNIVASKKMWEKEDENLYIRGMDSINVNNKAMAGKKTSSAEAVAIRKRKPCV
jgi:hypothetical protein